MFLQACVILFTGRGLAQCMLGYHPPPPHQEQATPPGAEPLEQAPPLGADPPGADPPELAPPRSRPPHCRACWEIRSTHGRYAFYWNGILFCVKLTRITLSKSCKLWILSLLWLYVKIAIPTPAQFTAAFNSPNFSRAVAVAASTFSSDVTCEVLQKAIKRIIIKMTR